MAANSTSSATALIERAIRDAPHAEAVAILIDICRTSRSGRRMLERRLLINDDTSQETSAAAVGSSNALSSTGRRRRAESPAGQRVAKRNRYEACKNCARHYDVSSNDVTACRWHSGHLKPDYASDAWMDHDEECHGRIEDLQNENPDGFKWSCCGFVAANKGCMQGKHNGPATITDSAADPDWEDPTPRPPTQGRERGMLEEIRDQVLRDRQGHGYRQPPPASPYNHPGRHVYGTVTVPSVARGNSWFWEDPRGTVRVAVHN